MNRYEEKQEERRRRYLERADKASAESDSRGESAMRMARCMNGQPILIGHHSEKRHRRDIARMDRDMSKAAELSRKADHYRGKAAGVGHAGISADDPEAVVKLREKLTALETLHARQKALQAAWRKAKRPDETAPLEVWEAIAKAGGMADGHGERLRVAFGRMYPYEKKRGPVPGYELSNRTANMKRIRERIAALEASDGAEDRTIEGDGWTIEEDTTDNRLRIAHDSKPPAEVRQRLKANGFRWARSVGAWQRQLNHNSRWAALRALELDYKDRLGALVLGCDPLCPDEDERPSEEDAERFHAALDAEGGAE